MTAKHCALAHEKFPYPITDVVGTARQKGDSFVIDFNGRGGNRPVKLTGLVSHPGPEAEADFDFQVQQVPLDDAVLIGRGRSTSAASHAHGAQASRLDGRSLPVSSPGRARGENRLADGGATRRRLAGIQPVSLPHRRSLGAIRLRFDQGDLDVRRIAGAPRPGPACGARAVS